MNLSKISLFALSLALGSFCAVKSDAFIVQMSGNSVELEYGLLGSDQQHIVQPDASRNFRIDETQLRPGHYFIDFVQDNGEKSRGYFYMNPDLLDPIVQIHINVEGSVTVIFSGNTRDIQVYCRSVLSERDSRHEIQDNIAAFDFEMPDSVLVLNVRGNEITLPLFPDYFNENGAVIEVPAPLPVEALVPAPVIEMPAPLPVQAAEIVAPEFVAMPIDENARREAGERWWRHYEENLDFYDPRAFAQRNAVKAFLDHSNKKYTSLFFKEDVCPQGEFPLSCSENARHFGITVHEMSRRPHNSMDSIDYLLNQVVRHDVEFLRIDYESNVISLEQTNKYLDQDRIRIDEDLEKYFPEPFRAPLRERSVSLILANYEPFLDLAARVADFLNEVIQTNSAEGKGQQAEALLAEYNCLVQNVPQIMGNNWQECWQKFAGDLYARNAASVMELNQKSLEVIAGKVQEKLREKGWGEGENIMRVAPVVQECHAQIYAEVNNVFSFFKDENRFQTHEEVLAWFGDNNAAHKQALEASLVRHRGMKDRGLNYSDKIKIHMSDYEYMLLTASFVRLACTKLNEADAAALKDSFHMIMVDQQGRCATGMFVRMFLTLNQALGSFVQHFDRLNEQVELIIR
jgi:hypothetical protein